MKPLLRLSVLLVALSACGGPADVAGTYTVSVTSQANACMLMGWDEGDTASNIEVVVTQTDGQASAEVRGLGGALLELWLGQRTLVGDVGGSSIDLSIIGNRMLDAPGCKYTMDARLQADVDGDFMKGELQYRPKPVEGTCGILEDCANIQAVNGTRPPSAE